MVITTQGLSGAALAVGSFAINKPSFMLIGSGSGTTLAGVTGLFAVIGSPQAFSSLDISTPGEITWQSEWTAPALSGLFLREFTLNTGSTNVEPWNYENLGQDVEFNGSNELRIELKLTFF